MLYTRINISGATISAMYYHVLNVLHPLKCSELLSHRARIIIPF